MKSLDLNEREAAVLLTVLEIAHKEKLHELHHTSTKDYAQRLRAEADVIERIHAKLSDVASIAASI
jgi:hypothetical protein